MSGVVDRELVRFVVVGVGSAGVLYLSGYLLQSLMGLAVFEATATAYLGAFVVAYLSHKFWTFGNRVSHQQALPRYLLTQLVCALLTAQVTTQFSVLFPGLRPAYYAGFATLLASTLSFISSKFWVFADARSK